MKIERIEAIPLVRKLDTEFVGGTYKIVSRNTLVTRVYTDVGVVGEAFGGDEDKLQPAIVKLMRGELSTLLIGQDARDVERLWEQMFFCDVDLGNRALHVLDLNNRAILMQAIAAIDNALWDAIGKFYNTPLYKLLGGYRDRVPVIAIGGYYYADDPHHEKLKEEVLGYQAAGLAGIKLKVGRAPLPVDLARAEAARQAAGDDFIIACDANQAWRAADAIRFCQAAAPLNIRWMEEPVRWYDQLDMLRQVGQVSPIPLNAGQGEITRYGCRDLVLQGGVRILNVDVTIAGGVTEWRRIAGMAAALNVEMAHHEEAQVALHLLASIPHGLYVEIFPNPKRDPMWYDLPVERPRIVDRHMLLPDKPGLGMELNGEVIEKYRID